jgi:hypothetical protein
MFQRDPMALYLGLPCDGALTVRHCLVLVRSWLLRFHEDCWKADAGRAQGVSRTGMMHGEATLA